jgi:hypothetical protein
MFGAVNPDIFHKPGSPDSPPPSPDQLSPDDGPDFGRVDPDLFRKKGPDIAGPPPEQGESPDLTLEPVEPPDLDTARRNFARKKRELEDIRGVRRLFGGRKTVAAELERAEKEYAEARAKFVEADAHGMLDERMKLVDEKMRTHAERKKGVGTKFYDWYKGLGRLNLERAFGITKAAEEDPDGKWNTKPRKVLRFFLRAANVRTAISTGLLGIGVGLGIGSAAGLAVLSARRVIGGIGAGVGTFDLSLWGMEAAGRRGERKTFEVIKTQIEGYLAKDPNAVWKREWLEEKLTTMERRAVLEGKNLESLRDSDETYKLLVTQYEKTLGRAFSEAGGQEATREYFDESLKDADQKLTRKLGKGKWKKRVAKALGMGIGVFIGSGMLAEMLHGKAQAAELKSSGSQPGASKIPEGGVKSAPGEGSKSSESLAQKPKSDVAEPKAGAKVPGGEPKTGGKPQAQESGTTKGTPQGAGRTPETAGSQQKPAAVTEKKGLPLEHRGRDSGARVEEVKTADGKTEYVIHAGKRGIEGATLDYLASVKGKDPQAYQSMLEALKQHAPKGGDLTKAKDLGRAVHHFMLDWTKQNPEWTLGKLNTIAQADLKVTPDGKFELLKDSIKDLPERALKNLEKAIAQAHGPGTGAASEAAAPAKVESLSAADTALAAVEKPSGVLGTKTQDIRAGGEKVPEKPLVSTRDIGRGKEGVVGGEKPAVSGSAETETRTAVPGAVEKPTLSRAEILSQVKDVPTTSKALEVVLGDQYEDFMKQLSLSAADADAVQHMSLEKFANAFGSNQLPEDRYGVLYGVLQAHEETEKWTPEYTAGTSVRTKLIEIAITKRKP